MSFYAGEKKENAERNRQCFFQGKGHSLDRSVFLQQTHSDHIIIIKENVIGQGSRDNKGALPDADAMITDIKGVALCVQVADCVPILLYDLTRGNIGVIHSGWRGTLKNIVGKTVFEMCNTFGSKPKDIQAQIGPAIGGCCLPVDTRISEPVKEKKFQGLSFDGSHWDIALACQGQLIESGIMSGNIVLSGECTACNVQKFFSYRKEGNHSGRMLAGICLL